MEKNNTELTRAMHHWYIENMGAIDFTLLFEYQFDLTMREAMLMIDALDNIYNKSFIKYCDYVRVQNQHMERIAPNQQKLVAPVSFKQWLKQEG